MVYVSCPTYCLRIILYDDVQMKYGFTGIDAITSDTIQARYSYTSSDIESEKMFVNIVSMDSKSGGVNVDFSKFHDLENVSTRDGGGAPPTSH